MDGQPFEGEMDGNSGNDDIFRTQAREMVGQKPDTVINDGLHKRVAHGVKLRWVLIDHIERSLGSAGEYPDGPLAEMSGSHNENGIFRKGLVKIGL